jgi:hypothetical protein
MYKLQLWFAELASELAQAASSSCGAAKKKRNREQQDRKAKTPACAGVLYIQP